MVLVEIREVRTMAQLKEFIKFPLKLYKDCEYYVPSLISDDLDTLRKDKNPAFEHCDAIYFMAYKGGKAVGRIGGIINRLENDIWEKKSCRFTHVDFIDDEDVSSALFSAVEKWGREHGLNEIHGPLGFTDFDREGLLVEGFDRMATLATIYNYPYYPKHLERLGYIKSVDWIEYLLNLKKEPQTNLDRLAGMVLKRGKFSVRKINSRKELLPYIYEVFNLLNECYQPLYGFVPLNEGQIEKYVAMYINIVNLDYITLIDDREGKLCAFGVAMPSMSKAVQKAKGRLLPTGIFKILKAMKNHDMVDLYLIAVRPDVQKMGVNAIIMNEILKGCLKNGVTRAESNPELETNSDVLNQWKYFETEQHKRRRCYKKDI
ncbi:MAG: hypothetical protein ACOYJD_07745 [Christensenellales bacterium]